MKLSKSFARLAPGAHKTEVQHDRSLRRKRSSLDNLVIPRRTRLPSSKVSQVEPFDLQIAMNLLSAQAHALPAIQSSAAASINLRTRDSCDVSITESDEPHTLSQSSGSFWFRNETMNGSFVGDEQHLGTGEDQHSTLVTGKESSSSSSERCEHHGLGVSYDGPTDFASDESRLTSLTLPSISDSATSVLRAGPAESAGKYNTLATVHGLSQSNVIQDHVKKQVHKSIEMQPRKQSHLSVFKNLVTTKGHHRRTPRRTTSSQSLKAKRPWSVSKGRMEDGIFQCTSLEELFRLGGCSTLKLPANFSPIETLVIPISLAATARNIVENGPAILGIFREGGAVLSIHKLCDYYNNLYQSHASAEDSSRVQSTIVANDLPSGIPCTIQDVASVFKKVVLNLPGGLLGSLELLEVLSEILLLFQGDAERPEPEASKLRARLIALALSCVSSDERFSVICATLGLFAWLGHAKEISMEGANMSYESLSTILSPLLVGDELNTEKEGRRAAAIEPQPENLGFLNLLPGDSAAISRAHQNTQDGAKVALMLLLEWKEIVKHLRCLATSAAMTLREKEEEDRLANAESVYSLGPTREFAKAKQPSDGSAEPDFLGPKSRHKKGFSQPSKAIALSSNSTTRTPIRSLLPSSRSVISLAPGPRQPAQSPGLVRLPDGTGGFVNVPAVHRANDGNKRRGRTTPLKKTAKSDPIVFASLEPESSYRIPKQQRQERIPSDPVLPYPVVKKAQQQQRSDQVHGVENQHFTETHKQAKAGPTYEPPDQPDYGHYDEDCNTEDRMSDYGALLPTEPSHSEGSKVDGDEEEEAYWRSQSVLQTFEKLKEIKADIARSKDYQQQPTTSDLHDDRKRGGLLDSAGSKFRPHGSAMTLMDRNGHSAQSSIDIAEFARAHHSAAFGSVNNRHQAPIYGLNVRTSSGFHEPTGKKVSSLHITSNAESEPGAMGTDVQVMRRRSQDSERPHSSHSRSQTANSIAGSQSGSVRQLAQRFDQPLQGHYVPDWPKSKSGASLDAKIVVSRPGNMEESLLNTTSESNPSPLSVPDPNDMPTPRARTKSMIPRPLSDVGRPRKKGERRDSRSPSPVKISTPVTAVRQRPPPFNIFTDDPYEAIMTGALDPLDFHIREPLSPTQGLSLLIYPEDPPLARVVKRSTGLTKSMTTPIISSRSSTLNSNQETSDSYPLRPISIESTLLVAHKDSDSQPSRRRYSASQNGDEYSASVYSTRSREMNSASRRVPKSMTTGNISLLFQENERLRLENERQTKMLEDYRRKEKEGEESKRHSELRFGRKIEAKDAEKDLRALKLLKVKYDEWTLVREARMLQYQHLFHHGREVNISIESFTTQEFIDGSGWDVESQGPYPKPLNKADQEMEIEAKFFVKGLSPYYICDTKEEERQDKRNLEPWIKKALEKQQRAREDAEIVLDEKKELEAFKEKMESVKEWDRQRHIKKRESEEWWERLTPAEKKKFAARYHPSTFQSRTKHESGDDELEGATEAERNRRAQQNFEKLLVEEFGADEATGTKRKWFGMRKGSGGNKSGGESPEERKEKKDTGSGRVRGMAKLFGGGRGS